MSEDEVTFRFLAEHSSDVVCRAALDMTLQYTSPAAFDLLGYQPEEMTGRSLTSFVAAEETPPFASAVSAPQASALEKAPMTLLMQKKDGASRSMEIRRRLLLDPETGEPREYVILVRDVQRGEPAGDEPSPVVFAGQITGLLTYPEFLKHLDHEWSRAHREGTSISLLRLDFNGFRQFYFLDRHRLGDGCLAKAAAAIKGVLRITDFAAQYLAEEIMVLLPSTDGPSAVKVAAKVRSAVNGLRSPRSIEGQAGSAVSIGIATVTAKAAGSPRMPELLLLSAEHALHRARQQEEESLSHIAACSARNVDWKKSMPGTPTRCA